MTTLQEMKDYILEDGDLGLSNTTYDNTKQNPFNFNFNLSLDQNKPTQQTDEQSQPNKENNTIVEDNATNGGITANLPQLDLNLPKIETPNTKIETPTFDSVNLGDVFKDIDLPEINGFNLGGMDLGITEGSTLGLDQIKGLTDNLFNFATNLGIDPNLLKTNSSIEIGSEGYGKISTGKDSPFVVNVTKDLDNYYSNVTKGTALEGLAGKDVYNLIKDPKEAVSSMAGQKIGEQIGKSIGNDSLGGALGQALVTGNPDSALRQIATDFAKNSIINTLGVQNLIPIFGQLNTAVQVFNAVTDIAESTFKEITSRWYKDINKGFKNLGSGIRRDLAQMRDDEKVRHATNEELFLYAANKDFSASLLAEKLLTEKEPSLFTREQKENTVNRYYEKEVRALKEEISYLKKNNSFFSQPFIDRKNKAKKNLYAQQAADIKKIEDQYTVYTPTYVSFSDIFKKPKAIRNQYGQVVRYG